MDDKTGVARLRQAIENQRDAGEACFTLPIGEAAAICDECEDELATLLWAKDVPTPKDADGVLAPLDATELYTDEGEMVDVRRIPFNGYSWYVWDSGRAYRLDTLHRAEQDSWEKLEEDVQKVKETGDICGYYDKVGKPCNGCPARNIPGVCSVIVLRDALRRSKALAGRGED